MTIGDHNQRRFTTKSVRGRKRSVVSQYSKVARRFSYLQAAHGYSYYPRISTGGVRHVRHAKVAIRMIGGDAVAAVIGSSNLTPRAYRDPVPLGMPYNHEADVMIWRDDGRLNAHFFADERTTQDPEFGEIAGREDSDAMPQLNRDVSQRLNALARLLRDNSRNFDLT